MLAVMSACFGFALNAHQNIVTNYFEDVLHLSGPQFGYITAIREVGGFLLIFFTALLYRISLQRVTAGALVLLGCRLRVLRSLDQLLDGRAVGDHQQSGVPHGAADPVLPRPEPDH